MSKKSDVWNHFTKMEVGGSCNIYSRCIHCQVEVKTSGNTTNLKNHLLRKHKDLFYKGKTILSLVEKRKKDSGGGKGVENEKHVRINLYLFLLTKNKYYLIFCHT